jgi:hypothetical protein
MPSDLQHQLFYLTFDGKLVLAPISKHPQHVLDVGTGTGIWAIDFGADNPMPASNWFFTNNEQPTLTHQQR